MSVGEWGLLLIVIAIGLRALAQIRTDPRITKEFRRKSYAAMACYALFVAAGIVVMVILMRGADGEAEVLAVTLFLLAWIALAALRLMRTAPRLREPPAWLMRPWSWPDWTLVLLMLICVLFVAL